MTATYTESMRAVFTPPPSCSSHWTYEAQTANHISGGLLLQNALYEAQDSPCYPSGMNAWGRAPSFYQVFSPGACPSGYTTALDQTYGPVTTAVCCLSNFAFTTTLSARNDDGDSAVFFGCTSMFQPDAGAAATFFAVNTITTGVIDGTTTGVTSISTPLTMWALPITVAYQQRDLSLFTTTSGPITSSATLPTRRTSTSVSSSSSTTTARETVSSTTDPKIVTSSPAPAPAHDSLSSGAIAGIAIGAAAVLGVLIGLAIFFKRSRRSPSPADYTSGDNKTSAPMPENWQPGQHGYHPNSAAVPYHVGQANKENLQYGYGELDAHTDRRYELG